MSKPLPLLLLVGRQTAAGMLGVGLTKIDELIAAGELRSMKIGRRRMIGIANLEAYVAKQLEAAEKNQESADA